MSTTPDLGIAMVTAGQAQQEVPHNEALVLLQTMLCGVNAVQNAPPASPTDGDAYIVGPAGSGDWVDQNNKLTVYYGGSWRFIPDVDDDGEDIPMGYRHEGLEVFVRDNGTASPTVGSRMRWTGAAWAVV